MRNPKFDRIIQQMRDIHDRKNHDYASDANPYSNFEFAGQLAAMFTRPVDQAFATLIGVKLARLAELTRGEKTPNHESVADTFVDLATYAALWASYDMAEIPPAAPYMDELRKLGAGLNTVRGHGGKSLQ